MSSFAYACILTDNVRLYTEYSCQGICIIGKGGERMENGQDMTDYQFRTLLRLVRQVLDGCKDLDEAKQRIDELLKKEK